MLSTFLYYKELIIDSSLITIRTFARTTSRISKLLTIF